MGLNRNRLTITPGGPWRLYTHPLPGWEMLGTDVNQNSLENAQKILESNPDLKENIQLKSQPEIDLIFKNFLLNVMAVEV